MNIEVLNVRPSAVSLRRVANASGAIRRPLNCSVVFMFASYLPAYMQLASAMLSSRRRDLSRRSAVDQFFRRLDGIRSRDVCLCRLLPRSLQITKGRGQERIRVYTSEAVRITARSETALTATSRCVRPTVNRGTNKRMNE